MILAYFQPLPRFLQSRTPLCPASSTSSPLVPPTLTAILPITRPDKLALQQKKGLCGAMAQWPDDESLLEKISEVPCLVLVK